MEPVKPRTPRLRRHQRGIVVLIALIVMVALSLAAVGLMRSVDTTSMIAGNIAFRQSAQSISASAIEKALYDMLPPPSGSGTINVVNHDPNKNYYAFWQNSDDAFGVPAALRGNLGAYPGTFQVLRDGVGNTARYVIERMCADATSLGLPAAADRCEMIPPKQNFGRTTNTPVGIALPRIPYYRLTVRVDGPGNSVTYAQTMILQ
jgi:Tfp pilus assembly protein PilX